MLHLISSKLMTPSASNCCNTQAHTHSYCYSPTLSVAVAAAAAVAVVAVAVTRTSLIEIHTMRMLPLIG